MLVSQISQWIAFAASTASPTARRFSTGSAPGSPRHVGHTCAFGSPPYWFTHPQKAFDAVSNWTWTSSPITGWYLARTSGETALIVDIFTSILATRPISRVPPLSASHPHARHLPPNACSTATHARRAKEPRAPQRAGHLRAGRQQRPPGAWPLQHLARHLRPRRRHLHGPFCLGQRHRNRAAHACRHGAHTHHALHRKDVLSARLHRRHPRALAALYREHPLPGGARPRRKEPLLEHRAPVGRRPAGKRPRSFCVRRAGHTHPRAVTRGRAVTRPAWPGRSKPPRCHHLLVRRHGRMDHRHRRVAGLRITLDHRLRH